MRSLATVPGKRRRKQERGFALLVVFLFAAVVAFSLYRQLPRAAFESTRDKEQLLIDRGNEFKRAIQVFYATNRRYPANMDELEKAADKRYLRRRYLDPMTGKDEWRIIHTNGSFLTDSLVQKPPAQAANGTPGVQGTATAPLGANSMNTASINFGSNLPVNSGGPGNNPSGMAVQAVNPAVLRRPNDRIANLGPAGNPLNPSNDDDASSRVSFDDPSTLPPITLLPQDQQQAAAQQIGSQQPGFPQPGFQEAFPQQGVQQPGLLPGSVNAPRLTGNPQGSAINQPDPFAPPAPAPFVGVLPPFSASGDPPSAAQLAEQQARARAALATAFGPQPNTSPFPQTQQDGNNAGILPAFTPSPQGIPGQLPGQGGANPQPVTVPNVPVSSAASNLVSVGPGGQIVPFGNQAQQGVISQNRTGGLPPPSGPNVGAANPAIALVNQQIRTPTPQTAQSPNAIQPVANNLGSPGIAGVASTFDGPSIKSFLDRTNYKEWEFVFQPQQGGAGQVPGGLQNPLQPGQQSTGQQNPGQQNFGLPGTQGFGQTGRPNTSQPNPSRPQQAPVFQGPNPSQGFQNLFRPGPGQPRR